MKRLMKNYDWIVVGGGITGAALSYELAKKGFTVLLLEKYSTLNNATRYSYASLPYSFGTTDLIKQLFQEGKQRHHYLSEELETDTQFRELDLLLTIAPEDDSEKIATNFPKNAIVFYNLGRIYKVNKNYDSAVNNYKKAIKLNPFEEKYKKAVIAVAQEMASNGDIEYRRQEFNSAIHYYKNSINYAKKNISLPVYPKLLNNEIDYICKIIGDIS